MLEEILLALGITLVLGKLFEALFQKLGLPPVLGDLILGLIVGASLLKLFPTTEVVEDLAWFGIIVLLFYAGLETRYREFMRNVPRFAIMTVGEAIAAFSLGFIAGLIFGPSFGYKNISMSAYFMGAVLEATSISLTVRTLIEIGKLSTPEGMAVLGIAVLDDLTALITIVIGSSLVTLGRVDIPTIMMIAVGAFAVWLAMTVGYHKISSKVVRYVYMLRLEEGVPSILLGILALTAFALGKVRLSPLIAAFAVGLAFSEIHGVRRIAERFRFLALIFSSLFFIYTSASIDMTKVLQPKYLLFYLTFVSFAFLGKMLGGGLTSYLLGYTPWAALRIAIGLFPRAEFCIIAAYMGHKYGLFGPEVYLAALMIVLITNIVTPPLLKIAYTRGPEIAFRKRGRHV